MKSMRLGTQLNISFGFVLLVPMIIATVFSIVYYSLKIQDEAIKTIQSEMKIAHLIYQNAEIEMQNHAEAYAQKNYITVLLNMNMGEKLGNELAKSSKIDDIDMVTVVNPEYNVQIRSHAPLKINDAFPKRKYIDLALEGKSFGGTEVLDVESLQQEGFDVENKLFQKSRVLTLTGVAPIYDRQREKIIGAMVVRRIIHPKSELLKKIAQTLNIHVAIFEHANLIGSASSQEKISEFNPPPMRILTSVIENKTMSHTVEMWKGGSISGYSPIIGVEDEPVGILMVQQDVQTYVKTRNTAIITLLSILLTGILLAFIIKTIIVRRIVNPINRLKEGTQKIGSQEYEQSLQVTSDDEIGELTAAFNSMALDLRLYDQQLKDYNQQLETRVKERTLELQITNQQLIHANTILEDTLERLNPGVSKLIEKNEQHLGLVFATELVADICNYTKLNMILGETMMGELMRKFFREGHKLIAMYRGMFDKTVGDQIVAIFGTPKDQSPASLIHPFDAIACALKLIEAAEKINSILSTAIQDNYTAIVARHRSLSKEDRETVKIEGLRFQCRVGINTSNPDSGREIDRMRMVMMGAETYVDYTAQGGAIIYAFRLESSGTPGQIHIGENSKRLVEHVYLLEELQPITLKGLGVQTRHHVIGKQNIFNNIYPQTLFYQKYCNNIPEFLVNLIDTIKIGTIVIKEVRKIVEKLEVDIPYMEHLAGLYHYGFSRALFAYSVAEAMEMHEERLKAIVFASLWINASKLEKSQIELNFKERYALETQMTEMLDATLVTSILDDLNQPKQQLIESTIITLCNQFDQMVFDRTYLKKRGNEIMSAKEVLSFMKVEAKYNTDVINTLENLMVVPDEIHLPTNTPSVQVISLPKDAELLARAIQFNYNDQQKESLMNVLKSDGCN